jgi:predicted acetyltransferase
MLISLVCLGWPMTPENIRLRQKFDKRWADFLGLYALDAGGRAVSQVQVLHIDTATKDGREKVAGISAVGTLPGYSRRSLSTALMKSAHERIRNEGIRLSLLTTSSSLVAHGMYSKLGYTTIATFQRGFRKVHYLPRRCGLKLMPFTQKDSKALDRAFAKQTSDALGFTYRQRCFLSIKIRCEPELAKSIKVAVNDEGIVGYARTRFEGSNVTVEELVAIDESTREDILVAVERKFKPEWLLCAGLCDSKLSEFYKRHGFTIYGPGWGKVMATCVDGSMDGRDVAELYAANDKRFIMYSLEDF